MKECKTHYRVAAWLIMPNALTTVLRMSVTSHRRRGTINLYNEDGETVPLELRTSLLSVDIPSGDEL